MDFALSAIDIKAGAQAGATMTVLNFDGSPLLNKLKKPITISLLGSDSDTYRRANRVLSRTRIARLQKSRNIAATDEEIDLQDKEDIKLLSDVTTGWDGLLDSKNKPVPFDNEAAVQLYTSYPVVREQAERFINDRTRFIQPS